MAISARATFGKHVCGAFGRTGPALAGVGQAGPELLELLGLQAPWLRRAVGAGRAVRNSIRCIRRPFVAGRLPGWRALCGRLRRSGERGFERPGENTLHETAFRRKRREYVETGVPPADATNRSVPKATGQPSAA